MTDQLVVRSHVARDLLQSAGVFRTEKAVIWEYVSNSLQYVDPSVSPEVRVQIDKKARRVSIADNGRGMDWAGLQNFFVMHGENQDRRRGNPGRGRFGTGKSAAFGIANRFRITTVRDGKQSIVELTRSDIERMNSEAPIPVQIIERERPSTKPNGTLVEIEEVKLRSINQASVIRYIERHLARWPRSARVWVNNHECEFIEPLIQDISHFRPEDELRNQVGNVTLTIKVAKAPLDEDLRGVSILSNGVWHESTLAGNEGREMSQYIFGEIDVPKLDEDDSPIAPFNLTRSMELNRNNDLVRAILAFVGAKVDEVRRELVKADKRRRADEEARKLATEAAKIAQILNDDLRSVEENLAALRARMPKNHNPSLLGTDESQVEGGLAQGGDVPAEPVSDTGGLGADGDGGGQGGEPRTLRPQLENAAGGRDRGRRTDNHRSQKPRGGFNVDFRNQGAETPRAVYAVEERTIYINLDHPQIEAARRLTNISDPVFLRLVYEVAFAEYSIALASEFDAKGHFIEPSDAIFDIRDTLNRVARRASHLYEVG
jgi:hypothetical protein